MSQWLFAVKGWRMHFTKIDIQLGPNRLVIEGKFSLADVTPLIDRFWQAQQPISPEAFTRFKEETAKLKTAEESNA